MCTKSIFWQTAQNMSDPLDENINIVLDTLPPRMSALYRSRQWQFWCTTQLHARYTHCAPPAACTTTPGRSNFTKHNEAIAVSGIQTIQALSSHKHTSNTQDAVPLQDAVRLTSSL